MNASRHIQTLIVLLAAATGSDSLRSEIVVNGVVNGGVIVQDGPVINIQGGAGRVVINGQVIVRGDRKSPDNKQEGQDGRPVLRWKNGESLKGELKGANADQVLWAAPLFKEPATLRMSQLKNMEASGNGVNPVDPLTVTLRNGDLVYGNLISLDADNLRLQSQSQGDLTLRRSELASVRRNQGGSIIYASPNPGVQWQAKIEPGIPGRQAATSGWRQAEGGIQMLDKWNRSTYLRLKLPEKVDIDLWLRSPGDMRFRLDLSQKPSASTPVIETWDDVLVLAYGKRFAVIEEMKAGGRDLHLRLCWDRVERRARVYSAAGAQLAEVSANDGPRLGLGETGISLRNTGSGIGLVSLRVREWNGTPPAAMNPNEPRVELKDGTVLPGAVASADDKTVRAQSGTGEPRTLKLEDVDSITFSEEPAGVKKNEQTELAFFDGGKVSGKLLGIKDEVASLETAWSPGPVSVKMSAVRLMSFAAADRTAPETEKPLSEMDRVVAGKISFHGTPVGSGDGSLQWLPVGGAGPVQLATDNPELEVVRSFPRDARFPHPPSLIYTHNGDILPGKLDGLDENLLHLKSDIADARQIPATSFYAVQFAGPEVSGSGFSDSGWVSVKGEEKGALPKEGSYTLSGAIGHPSIMQAEELKFSISTRQGYGVVRLRMFTDDLKTPGKGVALLLMLSGNQISCGTEAQNGQGLEDSRQVAVPHGKPAEVRLAIQEDSVEVFIGDFPLHKIKVTADKKLGLGLVMEPANFWGNGERPVVIANFSASMSSESLWFPPVDSESRLHALSVPRFRREDLPGHALVATNGDLLRGHIEGVTSDRILFRSGLEMLKVPRNRVSAAIRLTPPAKPATTAAPTTALPPAEAAVPADFKPTHWLLLRNGGRLALAVEKFEPERILGRSEMFGHCSVPMEMVSVIKFLAPKPSAVMMAFKSWHLQYTQDPVLPSTGGENSPMLGKDAPQFKLPLLGGGEFDLSQQRGKVVILDFWATWCGPCVKSLPELMEAVGSFEDSKVMLIGVNQGENGPVVKKFLEQRGWNLNVVLDAAQNAGRQYGVEGIPHTVIIGPTGKIAWVKTGYDPGGGKEVAETVKKLLEESGK